MRIPPCLREEGRGVCSWGGINTTLLCSARGVWGSGIHSLSILLEDTQSELSSAPPAFHVWWCPAPLCPQSWSSLIPVLHPCKPPFPWPGRECLLASTGHLGRSLTVPYVDQNCSHFSAHRLPCQVPRSLESPDFFALWFCSKVPSDGGLLSFDRGVVTPLSTFWLPKIHLNFTSPSIMIVLVRLFLLHILFSKLPT